MKHALSIVAGLFLLLAVGCVPNDPAMVKTTELRTLGSCPTVYRIEVEGRCYLITSNGGIVEHNPVKPE